MSKTVSQTQLIVRALDAIVKIPLPHDGMGTISASPRGAMDYQQDMRDARLYIVRIKQAIQYKEFIDEKDVISLERIATRALKGGEG
jgi:hypothetical protein